MTILASAILLSSGWLSTTMVGIQGAAFNSSGNPAEEEEDDDVPGVHVSQDQ